MSDLSLVYDRQFHTDYAVTLRIRPNPEYGFRAQWVSQDGAVVQTCEGETPQDAVAALFANTTPATLHHLKKSVMASLPPLRMHRKPETKLHDSTQEYCIRGHPLTGENLQVVVVGGVERRRCHQCQQANQRRYKRRHGMLPNSGSSSVREERTTAEESEVLA